MAIFGDMFDLNHDGNIDPSEEAMEFMLLDHLMMEKDHKEESEEEDYEEEPEEEDPEEEPEEDYEGESEEDSEDR